MENILDEKSSKQIFYNIWIKGKHFKKLTKEEEKIYNIMQEHYEYYVHYEVANTDELDYNKEDFNPFLHISLHLILEKTLENKKYAFIEDGIKKLTEKFGKHNSEHIFIEKLLQYLVSPNALQIPMLKNKVNIIIKKKLNEK